MERRKRKSNDDRVRLFSKFAIQQSRIARNDRKWNYMAHGTIVQINQERKKSWNMTWNAQEDPFVKIRYRLDQLEYTEFLHPESVTLVSRLLSDLVQTTQTSRVLKQQLDDALKEHEITKEQLIPTKQELVRITQENNHLHNDLIDMADQRDLVQRQTKQTIKKLESQLTEMKFVHSQLQQRVVETQEEKSKLRWEMEDLLRIQNGESQKKKKWFQRVPKIDLETGLAPLDHPTVFFSPPHPVHVDVLALQDQKEKELEQKIREQQVLVGELQSRIHVLEDQVSKRDREVVRLGSELEVARSHQFNAPQRLNATVVRSRVQGIHDLETAYDRIESLETQIEALQEHIDSLERELEQWEDKKMGYQTVLVEEKNHVERELEREKAKTQGLLENLTHLEKMVNELGHRAPSPVKPMPTSHIKVKVIDENAKAVQEWKEKYKMLQVKQEQSLKRLGMLQKDVQRLQNANKKLLTECEELRKNSLEEREQGRTGSVRVVKEPEPNTGKKAKEAKSEPSKEQVQLQELQRKWDQHQAQTKQLHQTIQDLRSENQRGEIQYQELVREKEELMEALEGFEIQIGELCDTVERVGRDRDRYRELYEQSHAQWGRERSEEKKGQSGSSHVRSEERSVAVPTRQESGVQTNTVTDSDSTEVDRLRQRETQLQQTVLELQTEVDTLKVDIEELVVRQRTTGSLATEAMNQLDVEVDGLKQHVQDLERENQTLLERMDRVQVEWNQTRQERDETLKRLDVEHKRVVELEIGKEESLFRVRELESRLSTLERSRNQLESEVQEKQQRIKDLEHMVDDFKVRAVQWEQERVRFVEEGSKKGETLFQTREELEVSRQRVVELEKELLGLKEEVEALTGHLNHQDRQVVQLQHELTDLQTQSEQWKQQATVILIDVGVSPRIATLGNGFGCVDS
jgi:chromosome segregation ATPase